MVSTQQLSSTGDLSFPTQKNSLRLELIISVSGWFSLAYLKMRFERGLCLGIRNADRGDAAGIGLGPVENFDAERNTDLAADTE